MNISKMMSAILRLSSTQRFSQIHLAKNENVLEHLGFITLLNYFIGLSLIEEGYEVDMAELLSKSVIHDFEEITTGDLPRGFKYSSVELRETIKHVETKSLLELISDIALPEIIITHWKESKNNSGEGSLVVCSDVIAALYKIYEEVVLRGNLTVCHVKNKNQKEVVREKINAVLIHFPDSKTIIKLEEYMIEIITETEVACGNKR